MSRFISPPIDIPAAHAELAYSVPTEWGGIHVTEEADEAYGLTPFVSVVKGGAFKQPGRLGSSKSIRTDVFLDGPTITSSDTDSDAHAPRRIKIDYGDNRSGFAISVGLPHAEVVVHDELEAHRQRVEEMGMTIDEAEFINESGEPVDLEEAISRSTPQLLGELFCDGVAKITGEATRVHIERRRARVNFRYVGIAPLIGAGLVTTGALLGQAEGLGDAIEYSVPSYLVFLAYPALALGRFANPKVTAERVVAHESMVDLHREAVTADIRNTFMRQNADARLRSIFDATPDA